MSRQAGYRRMILVAAPGVVLLLSLTFLFLPTQPRAALSALPPAPLPAAASAPSGTPAASGPSTEPFDRPWLEIPSIDKRGKPVSRTPEEIAARRIAEQYPADRAAILAELEGQSLEETIARAGSVMPHDAFTFPYSPIGSERQKYLLQDPRLARILHAAVHGSDAERESILHQVIETVEQRLAERRKMREGLPHDSDLAGEMPGNGIYPLVLAEVDTTGATLPLLLDWYNLTLGQASLDADTRARFEELGHSPPPEGAIVLPSINGETLLIAAAARRIATRAGLIPNGNEDTGGRTSGASIGAFRGGRWGVAVVDELAGYDLLEGMSPVDAFNTANELNAILENESNESGS